ncbi:MAG TPA: CPBP family glutamic-type intramembrane protease [Candidatus Saccharimonadia bacterium]|nr:CPBP family glutamic-type intramembrane protease [Candidatus Saccharimonadia bacterium]
MDDVSNSRRIIPYALIGMTAVSGFVMMGLRMPDLGWPLLVTTLGLTFLSRHPIRRHLPLVIASLALVALTPINTNVSVSHMLFMGAMIALAVAIPYFVTSKLYHEHIIRFPILSGRSWYKKEIVYIIFTALVAYFLLPFYLRSTGSYHNWSVYPGAANLTRLFIGTNGLGLWDELFFVTTVLAVFRFYLPFWWANIAQAVLWTSFLYELGFRGWGPVAIFVFALLQGQIFRRTGSLLYIVTIHLTLDFVLYLALVHAYYPQWLPIFIVH